MRVFDQLLDELKVGMIAWNVFELCVDVLVRPRFSEIMKKVFKNFCNFTW